MRSDVIVYFDYLCPYAWRGAELAELVTGQTGLIFEWRLFSLVQSNSTEPDYQIWNDRVDDTDPSGNRGLLPFLASLAARRQGRDAEDAFRLTLQRARFKDHATYGLQDIMKAAEACGLAADRFRHDLDDPELRTQLAQEHHQAACANVFGTPTFRFKDTGDTAYLRLRELPHDAAEAVELFGRHRSLLSDYPYLETVKRPRNGSN